MTERNGLAGLPYSQGFTHTKEFSVALMTARVRIAVRMAPLKRAMKKSEQLLSLFQLYSAKFLGGVWLGRVGVRKSVAI